MFDFDDVEVEDPVAGAHAETSDPREAAQKWAEELGDEEWKVRWEACRGLARLGAVAVPHLPALATLAQAEGDGDVREEARRAFQAVRETAGEEDLRVLVREAATSLRAEAFTARRNACFTLGALAEFALEHMAALAELKMEDDYMVRRAARNAYRELSMARARRDSEQPAEVEPVGEAASGCGYAGQTALFRVMRDLLPMRLERSSMTAAEVLEVWEQQWGIQHAGLITLEAEEGSTVRALHPDNDTLPRSPFVVKLDAPLSSTLQSMAWALKEYGMKTADEVAMARARKEQLLEAAARVEHEAPFCAKFRVLGEVLSMRLERGEMTPGEVAEVWEKQWGIQYAGKIRFETPKEWDSDKKWLHPKNDTVPLSPFVVGLETTTHKSRSIMYSLQACLKQYGKMSAEEVAEARAYRW